MNFISKCRFCATVFIHVSLYSQIKPVGNSGSAYTPPMNIPLILSGNYGEIRSGHFHTGIDIKTDQVEGKMIFTVDSGYVFRIGVHSGGYGNALYMKHPDGRVSVYGHLRQFVPVIESWVRDKQYQLKSFDVDLNPPAGLFVFRKGALIAFSGSTGFSGGPHLHFEIRDRSASIPLNALKYNFQIRDAIKPKINWLAIYPMDDSSTVNGLNRKLILRVTGSNGNYAPIHNNIALYGNIGFGIETIDLFDYSSNPCSPYDVRLFEDSLMHFRFVLDSIPFSLTACVNSHIDYEEKLNSGKTIQKLFVDPNNHLPIYKLSLKRGIIRFSDSLTHKINIWVSDAYGNTSAIRFKVRSSGKPVGLKIPTDSNVIGRFYYDSLNVYEQSDIRIIVPREALFTNVKFAFSREKKDSLNLSDIFDIDKVYTPLNKPYILSIKPRYIPPDLENKIMVAGFNKDGSTSSYGGTYKNGFITVMLKTFGRFFVSIDTLKPSITPVNFIAAKKYSDGQSISFRISDRQSGIRKYSGYIDEKWALFEYDAKSDLITYTMDRSRLESGKFHLLKITVTDNRDNFADFTGKFYF